MSQRERDIFGNPWRTHSTREIYDNAWISVREDAVTRPDGQPGIYGVVTMKNTAIGVLPVHADGSVTLVGQFRYTLGEYSWEIPEGGCPHGEEPLEAARRELREETGLAASTWRPLGRVHLSNSVCDEEGFLFLATGLEQFAPEPEGTEDLQIRRVPWPEALRMARESEITDGLSLMAIYRYALELASG
jgi:8-oxo-dGTP pyrophosphatase MutT (NUDIX family)